MYLYFIASRYNAGTPFATYFRTYIQNLFCGRRRSLLARVIDSTVFKGQRMQFPYKKILVLGNGGAGKSTFAADMGRRFSLPVVHLDKLWWLPGWVNRSTEEFDSLLFSELAKPAWVMDGNYHRTLRARLAAAERRLSRCPRRGVPRKRVRPRKGVCGQNAPRYGGGLSRARRR